MNTEDERTGEAAASDEPETGLDGSDALEDLRRALEEERVRAESHLANWQRTQADFANYRRRIEQERGDAARYSGAPVLASLLPVVDDLERALTSVPAQLLTFTWVDGVHLIYRRLLALLESHGVKAIDAQGLEFDPRYHQSVMRGPGPEGQVIADFQVGYCLYDRVLRPTMVQVGDGSGEASPQTAMNQEVPEPAEGSGVDGPEETPSRPEEPHST